MSPNDLESHRSTNQYRYFFNHFLLLFLHVYSYFLFQQKQKSQKPFENFPLFPSNHCVCSRALIYVCCALNIAHIIGWNRNGKVAHMCCWWTNLWILMCCYLLLDIKLWVIYRMDYKRQAKNFYYFFLCCKGKYLHHVFVLYLCF